MTTRQEGGVRTLTILGASGSIGGNAAEFLRYHPEEFRLDGIAVDKDWQAAAKLAAEFGCKRAAVRSAEGARALKDAMPGLEVASGDEGVCEVAASGADVVLAAISGSAGLPSVLAAIRAGSRVALANKEAVVCGGRQLMDLAEAKGVEVYPVDSEHSAIYQCLLSGKAAELASIVLTASGGPFRHATLEDMRGATPEQALAHPNWAMGRKNSLDSATLANKGLELIEACYLFDVPENAVEVLVNPTSTFHSAVRFIDGSMIAQIGDPDMRVPIGYALGCTERRYSGVGNFDLTKPGMFDFWAPDPARFPSLGLARAALREGQSETLLFNAANEMAGIAFLDGRIGFMDIPTAIEDCLEAGAGRFVTDLDGVIEADLAAKAFCEERVMAKAA